MYNAEMRLTVTAAVIAKLTMSQQTAWHISSKNGQHVDWRALRFNAPHETTSEMFFPANHLAWYW